MATDAAKDGLRRLRDSNVELFSDVSRWLAHLRKGDSAAIATSSAFRLTDGRTARIRMFYDFTAQAELRVVWTVESVDGNDAIKVFAVEHGS